MFSRNVFIFQAVGFFIGKINDDKLFAIKKGSGLVVGVGEGVLVSDGADPL